MRTFPLAWPCAAILTLTIVACSERQPQPDSLQQAQVALAAGQYQSATVSLKSYLQARPDDPEARLLLGKALLATSDPVSAEKQLRKAAELGLSQGRIALPLAQSLLEQGEFRRLLQEADIRHLTDAGDAALLHTYLGRANLGVGEVAQAEQQFAQARRLRPALPAARLGAVRVRLARGDAEHALADLNALLTAEPDSHEALKLRAGLLQTRGRWPDAVADYRRALTVQPDDVTARADLALLLLQQQDVTAAAHQLDELKRRSPQSLAANYLQALLAYRAGRYDESRKFADIALTGDPSHLPALFLAAATDYQLQDYVRAEARLRQVLDKQPMHFPAQRLLTATYLRLGQPNRAARILPYLLRPGMEDDADLAALAGEVFLSNQDFHHAELFFNHSARLDPASDDKRTALAMARLGEGKTEQALTELQSIAGKGKSLTADRVLIQQLLRQERAEQALGVARQMIERAPQQPEGHYWLAAARYALGDRAAALAALDECLRLDPFYAPALQTLTSMDLAAGQPQRAIQRYASLLAKRPADPALLSALARLQRKQGASPDAVLTLLERAINAHPESVDAYLEMAAAQLDFGMPKEAEATLQKGLSQRRNQPLLLDRLALAQYHQGDLERAVTTLFTLVEVDRGHAASVYARIAELQAASRKPAMALQTLQKALALAPASVPLQLAYARNLAAANRMQEALAAARRLQQAQGPTRAAGWLLEGQILADRQQWPAALGSFRQAHQLKPAAETVIRLHRSLSMLGKGVEAQQVVQSWLSSHPEDPAVLGYLGTLALQRNEPVAAARMLQQALTGNADNVEVLNNLALALWQQNQRAEAVTRAERASALAPADADVLDTLGWMLNETGQRGRGLQLLQRAAVLKADDPQIQYHLARALLSDQQPAAAKSRLEAALRLGDFPEREEAARLLKSL